MCPEMCVQENRSNKIMVEFTWLIKTPALTDLGPCNGYCIMYDAYQVGIKGNISIDFNVK